ncbi:MAG TPA: hypothetical protein ACFCUY_11165 [Xenococcaceae cyanobacterium]
MKYFIVCYRWLTQRRGDLCVAFILVFHVRKNSFSQLLQIVSYISDNTKYGLELIGTAIALISLFVL